MMDAIHGPDDTKRELGRIWEELGAIHETLLENAEYDHAALLESVMTALDAAIGYEGEAVS